MLILLRYTKDEVVGKALWEIGAIVDKESAISAFSALKASGYIRYEDIPLKTKQDLIINVEFVSNAYDVGDTRVIQCNIRDITARKKVEVELQASQVQLEKRNWAVLAYAQAALALFHADTVENLIQNVCNAIAEQPPYLVSWVGLAENDKNKTIRIAGVSGYAKAYTEDIIVSWFAETPYGLGPAGQLQKWHTNIMND